MKRERYLQYREKQNNLFVLLTGFVAFAFILMMFLIDFKEGSGEPELLPHLLALSVMGAALLSLLFYTTATMSVTLTARAYTAGLVRKKGTRNLFVWPQSGTRVPRRHSSQRSHGVGAHP
jgi:hypothetical protein